MSSQPMTVPFTCPGSDDLLVDVTEFFSEYLLIEGAVISENKLSLHLRNQDPEKTILDLEIWKVEQFKGTFNFRHFFGAEGATVIEVTYVPNESNTNADTHQWIPDDLVGWVEMKLKVAPQESNDGWQESSPMENFTKYSCLCFQRKSRRLTPWFFDRRLMVGDNELLDHSDEIPIPVKLSKVKDASFDQTPATFQPYNEEIPIPVELSKVIKKASFDSMLVTLQLHNGDLPEMMVAFLYLNIRNAGIRYLFPNWWDPKINPTKKAFVIKHKEDALVHISLRLPRTQERLHEMERNGSEILLKVKLDGSKKTPFFYFHLFFNKDSNKWEVSLSTEEPAGDWSSETPKKREPLSYRIK